MPGSTTDAREWLDHQVAKFTDVYPVYRAFGTTLDQVLALAAGGLSGHAIIQTRAKQIPSFAEKALRKQHKYSDPVNQFTDLCGGRVITRTGQEVEAIGDFIEEHFEIDRENSVDTSQRLRPVEFGYRSVHYIVSFRRGVDYGVEIPEELFTHPVSGLEDPARAAQLRLQAPKGEIQVRTILEHSYADFAHELSYKGAFQVPDTWLRELAGTAAALERVGQTFDGMERRLANYASSYGAYLTGEELAREIETLEIIVDHDPRDLSQVARLGKLLITAGHWDRAKRRLRPYVDKSDPAETHHPILRDLGVALCQQHKDEPEHPEYREGQEYLRMAAEPEHGDVDAIASYAGTWKGRDETKVRELYGHAFRVDPADPYALSNYLECEIQRDPAVIEHSRPIIRQSMERCRDHIEVGINLPWALYSLGELHLLLGEPYRSLDAYAKAIAASSAPFMIETSRASLDRLGKAGIEIAGYEWIRRLLILGLEARFPSDEARARVKQLASTGVGPIQPPAAIVVGGASLVEEQMSGYRQVMLEGFNGFEGVVISGGTTQGVPGLVGEITAAYPDRVTSIGYIPKYIPADATLDERYSELRHTDGHGFTPLEPLQNWIDLFNSDIRPEAVRVVGINGGRISAIEYRIALALGARLGVIAESGREVGRLVTDAYWSAEPSLLILPHDAATLRSYLGERTSTLEEDDRESLAQAIHQAYREARAAERLEGDLAMGSWAGLPDVLKQSNRDQALDVEQKLRSIGYAVEKADGNAVKPVNLSDDEIETLARMEHGRWNVERLATGWRLGERKDIARRISPYLVAWSDLPDSIRDYDREAVRRIPELLAREGFRVRKVE
jgi:ppGpp synthetase/RelA/SpoT-type nucleotidyltranferase